MLVVGVSNGGLQIVILIRSRIFMLYDLNEVLAIANMHVLSMDNDR